MIFKIYLFQFVAYYYATNRFYGLVAIKCTSNIKLKVLYRNSGKNPKLFTNCS